MGLGRRKNERQEDLFVSTSRLSSPGHVFYQKLNALLAEAKFDSWIEARCEPYYEPSKTRGRPSIPPGIYFRMLLVGYFEGIDSQRGIAWRCADSLSLREFLGLTLSEPTPDHSTLSYTRMRLPPEVFSEVFEFVLSLAHSKKLLSTKTVGIDSTTLEANAAMKSIVRKETGEDWKAYVVRLMQEQGEADKNNPPSDEEIRRFDKKRKDKKVSNEEWESTTDPEAKITKLKDGRTHLAYKAEHVVDLESEMIVAAEILPANHGDSQTMVDSIMAARIHLQAVDKTLDIEEVVADKGYFSAATLELCSDLNLRTYVPEPKRNRLCRWTNKPKEYRIAVMENRRRTRREKSKELQRLRSERCERSFAHVCDSGGTRRSWLRGIEDVTKRYLIATAAHNLSRMLWKMFKIGKPKALQGRFCLASLIQIHISTMWMTIKRCNATSNRKETSLRNTWRFFASAAENSINPTGC